MRAKFEYCKRAGDQGDRGGRSRARHAAARREVREGIRHPLAIHNHGPEDKIFPSPLDVLKDVRNMDPRMGCCIDVGHCVRAGTDVVEAIKAAGPRLFNMHMKDLTGLHIEREPGSSGRRQDARFAQIFEALMQINYPGLVDLEYEVHGDDPMPGVTESFAYMRGVLAGMGYNPPG